MKRIFSYVKQYIFRTLCVIFVLGLGLTQRTPEAIVVGIVVGACLLTIGSLQVLAYRGWINQPRRWLPIAAAIFVDIWVVIILQAALLPAVTAFVSVLVVGATILGALGSLEKLRYRTKATAT